jgi:hypothetical protein
LREFEGLAGLAHAVFRNEARRQLEDLRTRFSLTEDDRLSLSGAVVSMEESPSRIMGHYKGTAVDRGTVAYPERERMDKRIEAAAHLAADVWRHGRGVEQALDVFNSETRNIDRQVTALKRQLWDLEKLLMDLRNDSLEYRETYEALLDVKKEIIRLDKDRRRQIHEDLKKKSGAVRLEDRIKEDAEIEDAARKNATVRAHFRPLGTSSTARLLWHGYLSMMINGNIFLGLPMIDQGRSLADFKSLAKGRARFQAMGGNPRTEPRLSVPKLARAGARLGGFSKARLQG